MTTWTTLPVEMRAAVLAHIDGARDFVACMATSRLFYEAATDTQRRMWRYTPDQREPPNVFDTDEPVEVMAAVWNRWARRLCVDHGTVMLGPARRGRVDALVFACAITGIPDGDKPADVCLCPLYMRDLGYACECDNLCERQETRRQAVEYAAVGAAGHGHVAAVLYLVDIHNRLGGLLSDVLCTAAKAGRMDIIEAIIARHNVDAPTFTHVAESAVTASRPDVMFWLHDRGLLTDAAAGLVAEQLVRTAAGDGHLSALARAWTLLPPHSARRDAALWARALIRASQGGRTDVLAWLLDDARRLDGGNTNDAPDVMKRALCDAIACGHVDAVSFLCAQGVSLGSSQLAGALKHMIKWRGGAHNVAPMCERLAQSGLLGNGLFLAEVACRTDHAGLLAFATDRFGPHLAAEARRYLCLYSSPRVSAWLDEHFFCPGAPLPVGRCYG
ncbi:hypothetical protein pclt_cds_831 [Pandoravirus celtis]|uniref:Ankyrin repeat domain containing protein n=1 Tax=Pandoravirus celtis TaxID=2568002 RepID=A0A4D6EIT9_9VIRU|nr:hypothetical protein pclt_cds_831 [Pandoravirus celtis]